VEHIHIHWETNKKKNPGIKRFGELIFRRKKLRNESFYVRERKLIHKGTIKNYQNKLETKNS
jgi:hypothetical protein